MMQKIVDKYNLNLTERDGIWFSNKDPGKVSYPSAGYDYNFYIEEHSFWFKHRNNCIRTITQRFLPDPHIFWDIGGGNGYVSRMLQETGTPCILVEPDIRGCRNAIKRDVRHIICSRLEDVGLPAGTLDAGGLFDVIEHLEDDVGFLRTIHSFMHANSILFITVPAHPFLWSDLDVISEHHRRYTLKTLTGKLHTSNFKIIYHTYIFRFFSIPLFLLRSVPFYLRGKKIRDLESAAQRAVKEHATPRKWGGSIFERVLATESRVLEQSRMRHGSSLLVVAVPT